MTKKDKEANNEFPKKNGCIVNLKTTTGEAFSMRIKDPKGSPGNQLTCDDVKQKFLKNVLPVLGSEQAATAYTTLSQFENLEKTATGLGSLPPAPFSILSFLALPVIPELRLTDLGLVDVTQFKLI